MLGASHWRWRLVDIGLLRCHLGKGIGKLCNNGKVKTEFHFVMECSKLQTCEMSYSLLYPNVTMFYVP